jgi:hypothetical protein
MPDAFGIIGNHTENAGEPLFKGNPAVLPW